MKKFNLILALSISLGIASCNNGSQKTTAAETKDTATTIINEPAKSISTAPIDFITITHSVKDYNTWRAGFNAESVARKASGITVVSVERSADKPNDLEIVFAPSDMEKAKAFLADPRLTVLRSKLGVTSKPEVNFWNIIRNNAEKRVPGGTLLEITQKVKDFDAWVKIFDGEGTATRGANGLADIAIGRSKDDPNRIHLIFGVTDMDKAKARLANPEHKKMMEDAGVVGAPTVTFYNDYSK